MLQVFEAEVGEGDGFVGALVAALVETGGAAVGEHSEVGVGAGAGVEHEAMGPGGATAEAGADGRVGAFPIVGGRREGQDGGACGDDPAGRGGGAACVRAGPRGGVGAARLHAGAAGRDHQPAHWRLTGAAGGQPRHSLGGGAAAARP